MSGSPAFRQHVGRELRALRAEAQMSQAELAAKVGVTQASLSNYENGKRDIPLWLAMRVCAFTPSGAVPSLLLWWAYGPALLEPAEAAS